MFDEEELERIREGRDRWLERYEENKAEVASSQRKRLAVSLVGSLMFLTIFMSIVLSVTSVAAVGVGQVGGFHVEIGEIVGQDADIYPVVGETAACRNNVNDPEVPQSDEAFLPQLQADIGTGEIPAGSELRFIKDIKTPDIFGLDDFRLKLVRGETRSGLSYGTAEPVGRPSGGTVWIDGFDFGSIDYRSGLDKDDGYQDNKNIRTDVAKNGVYSLNVTVRQTATFSQHAYAWIDWDRDGSFESTEAYDLGLCDTSECDLGASITVPPVAEEGETVVRLAVKQGGDPSPGEDINAGEVEDYVVDVGPPRIDIDTAKYRDATGAYCYYEWVRRVQIGALDYPSAAVCDSATENYTDFTSANVLLTRGKDYTYNETVRARAGYDENVTVWFDWNQDEFISDGIAEMDASRYEDVSVTYPTYEWITEVAIEDSSGTQIWSHSSGEDTGDGYQDFTDGGVSNPRLTPGNDYTVSVTIDADSSYTERASVWFDWDQDREFDPDESGQVGFSGERYDIGSCTAPCTVSRTITIPDEGAYGNYASGPLMMRAGMNYSSNYPPCCGTSTYGEFEDYTVYIEEPENEDLTTDEGYYVGQVTGNESITDTITVPADADPGGTVMRANVRWAGQATPVPFDFRNNFDVYGQFEDYTVIVREGENDANTTRYDKAWTWYDYEWIDGVTINPPVLDTEFETEEDHEYLYYYGDSIAYADQTYNSTPVGQGGTYDIEVDVDDVGSTSYVDVWVDWDQDYSLESGEQNRIATTSCGYCSVSGQVNVPSSAPVGKTLMRVRLKQDGAAYGETEDYTLVVKENVDATQYSSVSGDTSFDEYIADVDFAGIANPTGDNGGYADFTNRSSVNLTKGGTYNAYMTLNTSGYEEHGKLWFDWDGDGSLGDETGYYLGNCSGTPTCVVSGQVNVPSDAASGPTLMRAYQEYSSEPDDPTTSPSYGEIEDYSVTVEQTLPTGYSSSNGANEWIDRVQFGGIDYTSGVDVDDGYEDNTGIETNNLTKGTTETLSVTVNQTDSNTEYVRAWFDWNGDGTLDTSYDIGSCSSGECTVSRNIQIPWDAQAGSYLGRIILKKGSYPSNPTSDVRSGEVEDYTVNVAPYTDSRSYGFDSEYIERFEVWGEGLDNPSGSSDYSDFTYLSTDTLEREISYYFIPTINMSTDDTKYVGIWIDWDGDGSFRDETRYEGTCDYDGCSVYEYIDVPNNAVSGETRLRVSVKDSGYPAYNETSFYGEVEDYTVDMARQDITLGDASLKFSELRAERVELESTEIDEEFSDGSSTDPTFGSGGSFHLSGQTVRITNATGRLHYVLFSELSFPQLRLDLVYNPDNPRVKDDIACLGFNVPTDSYADSSGYSFGGEHITLVDFAYPLYKSSGNDDGYADYTEEYASVQRGDSYTLEVDVDTGGGNEQHVFAWIDWDGDGSLADESPYDLGQRSTDGTLSTTVTVPNDANPTATMMRVTTKRNADPSYGETSFYGEVEDYTVVVED